jgi:hypothetical protein
MRQDKGFMNKVYHIYLKNECIYHSLSKEDFDILWDFAQKLTWLTDIKKEDIQYEELISNKEFSLSSSY